MTTMAIQDDLLYDGLCRASEQEQTRGEHLNEYVFPWPLDWRLSEIIKSLKFECLHKIYCRHQLAPQTPPARVWEKLGRRWELKIKRASFNIVPHHKCCLSWIIWFSLRQNEQFQVQGCALDTEMQRRRSIVAATCKSLVKLISIYGGFHLSE